MQDYYAILGVEADASAADIKAAYRKKAALFHPDRNADEDAPARFREAQEAYDILSDAGKRRDYDENRRRSLLDDPLQAAGDVWNSYIDEVLAGVAA